MKTPKTYSIEKTRNGKSEIITGTLPELISYFSYTLLSGHSWNPKIPTSPKTYKSLVKALNKSAEETQHGYSCTYYSEV